MQEYILRVSFTNFSNHYDSISLRESIVIIRQALKTDLDDVFSIVQSATRHMDRNGILQWDDIYPDTNALSTDIEHGEMLVILVKDTVVGFLTRNEEESPEFSSVQWQYSGRV